MSVVSSPFPANRTSWAFLYTAVVLTAAATLITEIALTRVFSVVFQSHYAFLAISIALFGLSAGGVLSYLLSTRGAALYRRLGSLSLLNAAAVLAALLVAVNAGAWHTRFFTLAAVYFAAAAPFVFSGIVLSLIIAETIQRVDRIYFFDLAGAAAGCLLAIPFLNVMGGPGAILGAAVLLAASAAVWFGLAGAWAGRALAAAAALGLVGLIVVSKSSRLIDVETAKGKNLRQETFVEWNSFSRVSLLEGAAGPLILLDADLSSRIPTFDPLALDENQRDELLRRGPGYAYRLRPGGKTLIIGAGGGWDVALALAAGSRNITAVEINPIIVNTIMRGRFRHLSRDLFRRPEVRVVVEDGRSFVRRSSQRFDLIQATLVDTRASTAAGAHALNENSIYTVEAFLDYLARLNPGGLLSFTHWGFDPPRESLRLVSLARAALLRAGEARPARHIVVLREDADDPVSAGATDTVLVSREPFSVEELERAALEAARARLDIVYMPGQAPDSPFATLLLSPDPSSFFRSYLYDVRPVTDDRPFFFFTARLDHLYASSTSPDPGSRATTVNLLVLAGVSLLATLVTLALPPIVLRARLGAAPGVRRFLMYFLCLGAGYVLVQVGLIQRLVMLLGHPTYALTVVIFSMLVWSSLGSFFSRRVVQDDDRRLLAVLAGAAVLIAATAALTAPFTNAGAPWGLPWKMLASMSLLAPAAFVMGMAFPAGLMRLDRWRPEAVRWAWSINAAASVLGSCTAVLLAVSAGLRNTLLCGALLYLGAFAAVACTRRFLPAGR